MNFLSLKNKLFFFSIVLSIVLTSIISILELNYDINNHIKDLDQELIHFEKTHEQYLSNKVWAMEYDSLKVFVENEVGEKFVNSLKIVDMRNKVIAQAREKLSEKFRDKHFNLTYVHNNKKSIIGEVYLRGNTPDFFEMLKARWADLIVINGLLVTIIFFSSYLLFYKNVLNRLLEIIRYTDQNSSVGIINEFFIPEMKGKPDEINLLIDSLNERTKKINDEFSKRIIAESSLKKKNKELLKEIEERSLVESALKTSQETFLTVLDGIDATIYVADIETYEILFVNKYMLESFGKEAIGKNVGMFLEEKPVPAPIVLTIKSLMKKGTLLKFVFGMAKILLPINGMSIMTAPLNGKMVE